MKNLIRKVRQVLVVVLGLGIALPLYAVKIINNVSTSASTGGNRAGSGEVVEGESEVRVKIYTTVDGEVVTDIDETVIAPGGVGEDLERNVEVSLPNVKSATSVQAEVNTNTEIESKAEEVIGQESIKPEKRNFIVAFLSKIFNYVFSIF